AWGSGDKACMLWDLENGKLERTLTGHSGGVRSIAFSAAGKLASGSDDGTIRIWDATTGKETSQPFDGHSAAVNSLALIDDDTSFLVSGGNDQTLKIWKSGKALATFPAHPNTASPV